MKEPSKYSILNDVDIGQNSILYDQVNLFKCKVGRNCKIDSFTYIEKGVEIGDNVKIRPFTFIPEGVTIENDVYIGPRVTFTNDKYPRVKGKWRLLRTFVKKGASIGAGCVIAPGITIGAYALIGVGSVVTKSIEDYAIAVGCPARVEGYVTDEEFKRKVKHFFKDIPLNDLKGESSEWPWP